MIAAIERLSVRVLGSLAEAEALVPEWEALLARSSCEVPFLSPQWLLPWWRVFGGLGGPQAGSSCASIREGGWRGWRCLSFRWHRYRPGIPFRRVELWGSGEDEADGICSDYLNVIAEAGREPAVARLFAATLKKLAGALARDGRAAHGRRSIRCRPCWRRHSATTDSARN